MNKAKVKGYALGVLAAATYGTNPLFALPLYATGMDVNSVLFWRYLAGLPMIWAMLALRGRGLSVSRPQLLPLAALGLLMGFSSFGLFASYRYMDASVASTLLFVYPLMVALIMMAFFRERLTMRVIVCLMLAMTGIWLLCRTSGGVTVSIPGLMWVIGSSLAYAVYIVAVNRIAAIRGMPTLQLTFYVLLFGIVIFAGGAVADGCFVVPHTLLQWGCVAGLAFFPTVLSFSLTNVAIKEIGSTAAAILGVFEPVTAVAIGVMVFGEVLTPRQIVGLVLVLGAVTTVIAGDNVPAALLRIRRMFPSLRHRKH